MDRVTCLEYSKVSIKNIIRCVRIELLYHLKLFRKKEVNDLSQHKSLPFLLMDLVKECPLVLSETLYKQQNLLILGTFCNLEITKHPLILKI